MKKITATIVAISIFLAGCTVAKESKPWNVVTDQETGTVIQWRCGTAKLQFEENICDVLIVVDGR